MGPRPWTFRPLFEERLISVAAPAGISTPASRHAASDGANASASRAPHVQSVATRWRREVRITKPVPAAARARHTAPGEDGPARLLQGRLQTSALWQLSSRGENVVVFRTAALARACVH